MRNELIKGAIRTWWPVGAVLVVMTIVSAFARQASMRLCGGQFIYPVDDTYIHIAIAKNIVRNGVWGVEPGVWSFSSSSPLWTILLTVIFLVIGVCESVLWYIAHSFNLATVIIADVIFRRCEVRVWMRLVLLMMTAVAAPFFCTSALGMEHSMHAFLLLSVLAVAFSDKRYDRKRLFILCTTAALATATRYESLFFLFPFLAGLVWLRRDVRIIAFALPSAIFPVVAYGLWSLSKGGCFLPNSLLVKGSFLTIGGVFSKALGLFLQIPLLCEYLYALAIALAVLAILPGVRAFWRMACVSVIVMIGGHLVFAAVIRQLCRYDAYLFVMGTVVLFCTVVTATSVHRLLDLARLLVPGLIVPLLGARAALEIPYVIAASEDIYSQQVQIVRIMSSLPEIARGRVAVNDIGYFSLHAGLPIFDMIGLGTQEMAIAKHERNRRGELFTVDEFSEFLNRYDVRYAVFFEAWFPEKGRPRDFKPVAYLLLHGNRICGADVVTFCARREEDVEPLRAHLAHFANELPPRAQLCQ